MSAITVGQTQLSFYIKWMGGSYPQQAFGNMCVTLFEYYDPGAPGTAVVS